MGNTGRDLAGDGVQVPGRVGDAAVPGGGAYADSEVGACGSTGDGDLHLRFLPCYQARPPAPQYPPPLPPTTTVLHSEKGRAL